MNKFKQIVGALLVILFIGMTVYYLYKNGANDNESAMKLIKSTVLPNGKIVDGIHNLGVKDKNDIRWWYSGKNAIKIEYGSILLKYDMESFISAKVQADLNYIGISTKQHKETLKFRLFYWGEELPEYAETSIWDTFKFWER